MISQIKHQDIIQAKIMQKVFNDSYAVEAKILNAVDFPPLNRTIDEYMDVDSAFFGYWKDENLAAVVEIKSDEVTTHIQSLVVSPKYFRQGIAAKLMVYVLKNSATDDIFVETGVDNLPAIKLYEKFGFKQVEEWDTEFGIRKVKLEKYN